MKHSWRWGAEDWVIRVRKGRPAPRSRGAGTPRNRWVNGHSSGYRRWSRTAVYAALSYAAIKYAKTGKGANHIKYLLRKLGIEISGHGTQIGNCLLATFSKPMTAEERVYKLILSPSEGAAMSETEMRDFLFLTMGKLAMTAGKDRLGQQLLWAAVKHRNSSHDHWHVLIHGITTDGQAVWIMPGISRSIRQLAMASQDDVYGPTHIPQWAAQERKAAGKLRFGPATYALDTVISKRCDGLSWDDALGQIERVRRPALKARLYLLHSAGIVKEVNGTLQVDYEEQIAVEKKLDQSRARLEDVPLLFAESQNLQVATKSTSRYEGLITGFGIDRISGRPWAVFESLKGPAFVVDVARSDMTRLIAAHQNAQLVNLASLQLRPRKGHTYYRAKKMGASGPIVDFLATLDWRDGQLQNYPWATVRIPQTTATNTSQLPLDASSRTIESDRKIEY